MTPTYIYYAFVSSKIIMQKSYFQSKEQNFHLYLTSGYNLLMRQLLDLLKIHPHLLHHHHFCHNPLLQNYHHFPPYLPFHLHLHCHHHHGYRTPFHLHLYCHHHHGYRTPFHLHLHCHHHHGYRTPFHLHLHHRHHHHH